jgi:hypothetical protein
MHVLPRGFQRVRYFGLFSHRQRATQEQVSAALEGVEAVGTTAEAAVLEASKAEQPLVKTCTACGQGIRASEGERGDAAELVRHSDCLTLRHGRGSCPVGNPPRPCSVSRRVAL